MFASMRAGGSREVEDDDDEEEEVEIIAKVSDVTDHNTSRQYITCTCTHRDTHTHTHRDHTSLLSSDNPHHNHQLTIPSLVTATNRLETPIEWADTVQPALVLVK